MPILGREEKAELEAMIHARLASLYDAQGAGALMAPRLAVVLRATGITVEDATDARDALACVELQGLFTLLCYRASDGGPPMPRDALQNLATEAASAAALQVNRIAPG